MHQYRNRAALLFVTLQHCKLSLKAESNCVDRYICFGLIRACCCQQRFTAYMLLSHFLVGTPMVNFFNADVDGNELTQARTLTPLKFTVQVPHSPLLQLYFMSTFAALAIIATFCPR